MLLKISNATKIYNTKIVLDNIDFEVKGFDIIGIIGRNGCGKSTLLKIIAEEIYLDQGEIHKAKNLSIGYLRQDVFTSLENSVYEELTQVFSELSLLQTQINELALNLNDEQNLNLYTKKLATFEQLGGYRFESEIKTMFTKFGFKESELHKKIQEFSGGQKTKLALIKLLLQKPDILLLDEPTNHLDLSTVEWLEGYLKNYTKAIIVVSHDRMFLNNICKVLYEIELGQIDYYPGNYDYYIEEKQKRKNRQHQLYVKQQEEISRLEMLIEKFRYKKSKASFVKSKIKYLDRMDKLEDVKKNDKVFKAEFYARIKSGNKVLEVDELAIGYDQILAKCSFELYRHDRVAIIGDNGRGKSTLLKTLCEEIPKLGGDYLYGHHVELGYFDQNFANLNNENTVLEEIWSEFPQLDQLEVRTALGTFLFTQDEVFKKLNVLSLGEKVRLSLLKLMLLAPNLLLLDEPTNHLDIPSKEALETALMNYDGTILFVSHDRYFIKKMAQKILLFKNDQVVFSELQHLEQLEEEIIVKKTKVDKVKTVNLGREIKKIEIKITNIEAKIANLKQAQFDEDIYMDYQKMQEIQESLDQCYQELEYYYSLWEEYQNKV